MSSKEHIFLSLTAQVVGSYIRRNPVPAEQLPDLIQDVHQTLRALTTARSNRAQRPMPAVPVRRSVLPDEIICLECGRSSKMLKRHLATAHRLTPEAFRQRWGLSLDYPMVAPNYAKRRSAMARQSGLGTRKGGVSATGGTKTA